MHTVSQRMYTHVVVVDSQVNDAQQQQHQQQTQQQQQKQQKDQRDLMQAADWNQYAGPSGARAERAAEYPIMVRSAEWGSAAVQ